VPWRAAIGFGAVARIVRIYERPRYSTPLNDKFENTGHQVGIRGTREETPGQLDESMTGHLLGAAGGLETIISRPRPGAAQTSPKITTTPGSRL